MSTSSTMQKTMAALFNPTNISHYSQKLQKSLIKLQTFTIANYHRGRLILQGPVRNGYLVSRELLLLVGRERQWKLSKQIVEQAKVEYKTLWETLRQFNNWNAIKSRVAVANWNHFANATLITGEILSLYYLGKFATRTTRNTAKIVM